MSLAHWIIDISLCVVTASCWTGAAGMWRMRTPTQALHYLSLPADIGAVALVVAVALQGGAGAASAKVALIAAVLIATNSIVTHATARAFRVRALGHWEPLPGEQLEMVDGAYKDRTL